MKQQCVGLRYKEIGVLLSSTAAASDWFGTSAAVDMGRLVVGSYVEDAAALDTGRVCVYDWNGSGYTEVTTITASDAEACGRFGNSVALSSNSNRLVVGAHGADSAGKVYIYDWDGSGYTEVTTITASDGQAYEQFGSSVAISADGTKLVVGAPREDTAGTNAGRVCIYEWNGSGYTEVTTITASDAEAGNWFGNSVALSSNSNRLVVGAHGADSAGKVYIYDWDGSGYTEVTTITASDRQAYDLFGGSVAIDGTKLVVGAPLEDTAGPEAGKVYIYEWSGSGYSEVTTITASDAEACDWFGNSVSIDGTRLVVGACGADTAGIDDGKVYIYDWDGNEEQ